MSNYRRKPPGTRIEIWTDRIRDFLTREVWSAELGALPTFRAMFYKVARVLFLAGRGVIVDKCLFRASALTYITVLSVVPLLAFAFSVAKGLGAYDTLKQNTIDPFLDRTIGEDTLGGAEATATAELRGAVDQVLDFVQDTNVSSLGIFGLAILVYTVIKLLSSIEKSFNDIWGIAKSRSIFRKIADYLSMVIIVPIFLVSATAITTGIQSGSATTFLQEKLHLGPVIELGLKFSSLAAMWIGFAVLYLFMPNTRTRVTSALIGGIVGGTLWHVAQILHVKFQLGMANYNAIYSGFAAFPIFLIWIYVSWVTVLLGAEFAFAHQNEPAYRQIARTRHHDHAFKELLAVRAVARVATVFLKGESPLLEIELADALRTPQHTVGEVVERLTAAGILAVADSTSAPAVLPARDLGRITIKEIIDALKGTTGPVTLPVSDAIDRAVDQALARYGDETERSIHNRTALQLAEAAIANDEPERAAEPVGGTPEPAAG